MGKRSTFDRNESQSKRDYYPTIDPAAVAPLAEHIRGSKYVEPCRGQNHLIELIGDVAECVHASDITEGVDASDYPAELAKDADWFITNPPFTWKVLSPIMDSLMSIKPVWLLLPADMMHNKRMGPYMAKCSKIVSVGRLYWMENKVKGVDNYVWYLIDSKHEGPTEFIGRK